MASEAMKQVVTMMNNSGPKFDGNMDYLTMRQLAERMTLNVLGVLEKKQNGK